MTDGGSSDVAIDDGVVDLGIVDPREDESGSRKDHLVVR
jgi:hypothetical protein